MEWAKIPRLLLINLLMVLFCAFYCRKTECTVSALDLFVVCFDHILIFLLIMLKNNVKTYYSSEKIVIIVKRAIKIRAGMLEQIQKAEKLENWMAEYLTVKLNHLAKFYHMAE